MDSGVYLQIPLDIAAFFRYNKENEGEGNGVMASYKQICMEYMRREKIKHEDVREFVVKVSYKGENLTSIPIFLYFDEDGDPIVSVKCWNITNFADQTELGIRVCNDLNAKHRWVKFYIDEDGDAIAELDAYVDEKKCGPVCVSLIRRMASIVDEAYEVMMHALWG